MDTHPLLVHFPIGLLVLYAILVIAPTERWYPKTSWESVKLVLSMTGALGAVAAIITGFLAAGLQTGAFAQQVIRVHEPMAIASALIFALMAGSHLVRWIAQNHPNLSGRPDGVFASLRRAADLISKRAVAVPLAVLGLALITITGALGGVLVYGVNVDPFAKLVYSIFIR